MYDIRSIVHILLHIRNVIIIILNSRQMGGSCCSGAFSPVASEPQKIAFVNYTKIPEHEFRKIISSVFSELMTPDASRESDVFLYFKKECLQRSGQFSSLTEKQIEKTVATLFLNENFVRELCRELGNYVAAPDDNAVTCMTYLKTILFGCKLLAVNKFFVILLCA